MIVEEMIDEGMIDEGMIDEGMIEEGMIEEGMIDEGMIVCEKIIVCDKMIDCEGMIDIIDIGGENVCPAAGGTIASTIGLVHCFGRARLPATTPLPATTVWIA